MTSGNVGNLFSILRSIKALWYHLSYPAKHRTLGTHLSYEGSVKALWRYFLHTTTIRPYSIILLSNRASKLLSVYSILQEAGAWEHLFSIYLS